METVNLLRGRGKLKRLALHQEAGVPNVNVKDFGYVRGTLDFVRAPLRGTIDMGIAIDRSLTNF
jgi:hypothetical protein